MIKRVIRVRRGVSAAGAAFALLLATRAVAYAHAMLVSAEPPANARLSTSPPRVRLVFSEELDPALAHIALVSSDGSIKELKARGDPRDVRAVVAGVDSLAAGAYRVRWRVVSADGHPVEGSYPFFVGTSSVQAPVADTAGNAQATWGPSVAGAPIVPAAARGLGVGALMALAGFLGFATFSRKSIDDGTAARVQRVASSLAAAAAILLGVYFVAWLLNATPTHAVGGDDTTALLGSRIARVEEWRLGLAVLALWAAVLARRRSLAFAFAALATAASGATGHSAAMSPILAIPSRALHLLAGAAWLGGLLWILAVRESDPADFRREAMRVSAVALWAALLVVVSGTLQAVLFLPSISALFTSAYGAVTLAKVAGFCALVGFGAYHRSRSLPRLAADVATTGAFRRVLRAEVAVMVLVILLGGWLAYLSPPLAEPSAAHTHT